MVGLFSRAWTHPEAPHNWWRSEANHVDRFGLFILGWIIIGMAGLAVAIGGVLIAVFVTALLHDPRLLLLPLILALVIATIWRLTG